MYSYYGKKRSSGGGGGGGGNVGPLVSIPGGSPATTWIDGIAGMTESDEFTIAMRMVFSGAPSLNDALLGFNWNQLVHAGDTTIFGGLNTSAFTGIPLDAGTTTFGTGQDDTLILAMMLVGDISQNLSGGHTATLWVNGSVEDSDDTTPSGTWRFNDATVPLRIWNNAGGNGTNSSFQTNGLYVSPHAFDPVTHWSTFFDGANQFQASIPTDGVINGNVPALWQNGTVTDSGETPAEIWNRGTDNAGRAYTMNGGAT